MKKILLGLLLSSTCHGASKQEKLLIKFYAKANPSVQKEYLQEVVRDTEKYLKKVKLLGQEETFLSMGHRESGFNMFSDDRDLVGLRKHSVGLYQTRADYRKWLRTWWGLRGVKLGPDDSLDTQCAFGVAEFRVHLNRARGNVWGGVRRYNGHGKRAQDYAKKVFISRRVIFGKPHEDGEFVKVDPIK